MPKAGQSIRDKRVEQLKRMAGAEYAMSVASDFIMLQKPERANAVKFLSALSSTIDDQQKVGA